MDEIKQNVAKNIAANRKKLNMTQLQLAEKLNYSDKAVSKWERGEAVPDIYIMKELADMFGITIDELIGSKEPAPPVPKEKKPPLSRKNKVIITLLSAGLVWLVASIVFVALIWAGTDLRSWLAFIYAIPATAIVLIVFSSLWGNKIFTATFVSALIWTVALAVLLTFSLTNIWLIFVIGIPLQVLTILWFLLKRK